MGFAERLRDSSKRHQSRVIVALDLSGDPDGRPRRAASLLDNLGDRVAGVKLNFQVILPQGIAGIAPIVEVASKRGTPLIADIKLNDIESTNMETAEMLFGGGFDAVIANPFVGSEEGLGGVIEMARKSGRGVLLLVYMSHKGAREGYDLRVNGEPLYIIFAKRVRDWKAAGAIVSSRSPEIIRTVREILGPAPLILSPGIGFQGGDPGEAIRAGTDFAIVGRSIVEAPDPVRALESFNRSISVVS